MSVVFRHLNPFWLYLLLSFLVLYISWTAVCSDISAKLATAPREARLLLWDGSRTCFVRDAVQIGSEQWQQKESFHVIISASTEGFGMTIHPTTAARISWGATVTHFMGITKQGFRLDFCSLSGFPVHNANSMKAIIMQLLTFSLLTMVARPHAYLFSYTKNMHMYIHLCTSRCCLFHSFRKNKLVSVQIGWFQHK